MSGRADRNSLVSEIHRNLGSSVKIVHGISPGHIGLVGGNRSAFLPNWDKILATLGNTTFGATTEFRS